MNDDIKTLIDDFLLYAQKSLKLKGNIKIILKHDKENARDPLGKTGYYSPDDSSITIFVTGRHIKDCLRSFAHECIHVYQDQNGQFRDNRFGIGENYFQKNKYMCELEKEAYEKGNMLFRQWEEKKKSLSSKQTK